MLNNKDVKTCGKSESLEFYLINAIQEGEYIRKTGLRGKTLHDDAGRVGLDVVGGLWGHRGTRVPVQDRLVGRWGRVDRRAGLKVCHWGREKGASRRGCLCGSREKRGGSGWLVGAGCCHLRHLAVGDHGRHPGASVLGGRRRCGRNGRHHCPTGRGDKRALGGDKLRGGDGRRHGRQKTRRWRHVRRAARENQIHVLARALQHFYVALLVANIHELLVLVDGRRLSGLLRVHLYESLSWRRALQMQSQIEKIVED